MEGDYAGRSFTVSHASGFADVGMACYCPGTLIQTERGQKRVEDLKIGDEVMTMSGALRPIKWIGRRRYGGRFVMGRKDILPICIKAGALDDNVPRRDLWISPHHAMYFKDKHLEGVLIEAKDLVNGASIVLVERVDKVEYFHIELDTHDVIIAEGALSESYIDDDSRGIFHNADEYRVLYPETVTGIAQYCAPRLEDGYEVEAIRQQIALRAGLVLAEKRIGQLARSRQSRHQQLHCRLGAEYRPSRSAGLSRHLCRWPANRPGSGQSLSRRSRASRHRQRLSRLRVYSARWTNFCSRRCRRPAFARRRSTRPDHHINGCGATSTGNARLNHRGITEW